jgi:hypothetical protein
MKSLCMIFCLGLWAVQCLAQTVRTSEPLVGDAFFAPDGKHLISTSGQIFDLRPIKKGPRVAAEQKIYTRA